jgi:hypothetical protein
MLFRTLAALAFAVSFDVLLSDGKYMHAAQQIALAIYQHF